MHLHGPSTKKMQIRIKKFENGVACKCNQSTKLVYTLIISNIPYNANIYIYIFVSVYTANYMLIP